MGKAIGWAEPGVLIGQPRVQKVAGFTYLYAEQQLVIKTEVGNYLPGLYEKVQAAYEERFGSAEKPARLLMCMNVPGQDRMYHL